MFTVKATNLITWVVIGVLLFVTYFIPVSHAFSNEELFYNSQVSQFMTAVSPLKNIFYPKLRPSNGISAETTCLACVFALRIVEQIALKEEMPIETVLHNACKKLGSKVYVQTCDLIVTLWGPEIIKLLEKGDSLDIICQKIHLCKNPTCTLYKTGTKNMYFLNKAKIEQKNRGIARPPLKILSASEFKENVQAIASYFQKFSNLSAQPLPKVDEDQDMFSTEFGSRGTAWRGRDCSPHNPKIYPGRKNVTGVASGEDFNCNGIYGVNPKTKRQYKDELCPGELSGRGIAVIGDSVGARFRFPEQFLLASTISWDLIGMIPDVIENEADFPQHSWGTGYMEQDKLVNPFEGPLNSVYQTIRNRNRCSHRDYQNIAVNGATSYSFTEAVKVLKRDQKTDNPMTVFVEFVGNDVCGSVATPSYTPLADFYQNIMAGLRALDQKLPPNSHVLLIGVADGRFLWDALNTKIHPIGTPYPHFYNFLSCSQSNPCETWLNTNSTMRDQTSRHAELLSSIYLPLIENHSNEFKNFKMFFIPNPAIDIMKECAQNPSCDPAALIEPVCGFHPGQKMQPTMARKFLEKSTLLYPDIIGRENPNNALIEQMFGDQGGH